MTDGTVKSAVRAFEIVDAFRNERRRMTAAQLGVLLDYPRSSLNVLLKSLTSQGYLSFAMHDQTYFPTLHVTHLGDWVPQALFGTSGAVHLLEKLRDETRETVTLTMATGHHMRCLIALNGNHPIGLQLEEGTQFPMFSSGVGVAYLSSLSDEAIATLRKPRNNPKFRRTPVIDPALSDEIALARANGYCTMYNAVVPDAGVIAMPLEATAFGETLVLAVAGLSSRILGAEDRLIAALQKTVAAVASQ